MYTVTINDGPLTAEDNVVYFCEEVHVEVEIITLPPVAGTEEGLDRELLLKWVVFVPKNGSQMVRGKLAKVPYERLVMISEDQ